MLTQIKAIVKKYLLKALRNKFFYSILFISFIYIYAVNVLKFFNISNTYQFIVDFSLSGIFNLGVILVLILGVNEITSEINNKNIYMVVTKPVDRLIYLIGKLTGIMTIILVFMLVIGIELLIVISKYRTGMIGQVIGALFLIYIKLGIISSLVLMFSLFSSPTVNVFLTILISVFGHMSINRINILMAESYPESVTAILRFLKFIFPSFEFFKINQALLQFMKIDFLYFLEVGVYGILYIFFIMMIANLIFRVKEL